MFDYGSWKNQELYGQKTPPKIDVGKITEVKTAMFVGSYDQLADPLDTRISRDVINGAGDALVYYNEHPLGHSSFMVSTDMSYFDDVVSLINMYNPKPSPSEAAAQV